MEIIFIIILTIITLTVIVLSYFERKDLLDRLMSKNITEYKSLKEEQNQLEDEDDNLISILDAREEILNESN